jgi:hypothetical protein
MMFYYIFYYITDPSSSILYINENPYLVSALKSGVLDCVIKTCNESVHHDILNLRNTGKDVKLNDNNIPEIIELNPELKRKKNLIEMRAPAFWNLIQKLQMSQVNNILGFNDRTPQIISSILSDNNRICEYANVMGIDPEFALNELKMLSDSLIIDDFRMFTLSMFWQKKINSCETEEEVRLLREPINRSFWSAGIPNV